MVHFVWKTALKGKSKEKQVGGSQIQIVKNQNICLTLFPDLSK